MLLCWLVREYSAQVRNYCWEMGENSLKIATDQRLPMFWAPSSRFCQLSRSRYHQYSPNSINHKHYSEQLPSSTLFKPRERRWALFFWHSLLYLIVLPIAPYLNKSNNSTPNAEADLADDVIPWVQTQAHYLRVLLGIHPYCNWEAILVRLQPSWIYECLPLDEQRNIAYQQYRCE